MPMHKILIDTDPGIDDAMAILYAGLHPDIEIVGLTAVYGNINVDIATRNALVLGDMLGRPIPVARGAEIPLLQKPKPVSDHVHGKEGFGELPAQTTHRRAEREDAAGFICTMINENPGQITLAPIGPLTNIATALFKDPSIAAKTKGVVLMGGSLDRGNVTKWAEANIWNDPEAANVVFAADWPVTMAGLDVTTQVRCTPGDFDMLAHQAPKLGGFLRDITGFYMRFYESRYGFSGACMHDPTALIAVTNPELFTVETTAVEVIVSGERAGQTIRAAGAGRCPASVLTGVNAAGVKERFFTTLATGH